ncbi:MAG: Hsp20/alpha crystallin family protein [Beijerinckiaceae bacterium]
MVEKSHTAGWWPNLYEPLRQVREKVADWFAPRADACAGESAYEIALELPGVKQDDVEISLHDNSLVVRGQKHSQHEEKGRNYFFSEREYGSFQRTFRLPPDSDTSRIDATFDAGVLSIAVPRTTVAQSGEKKIPIRKRG